MPERILRLVLLDGLTLYEEAHTLQRGMVSNRVADDIPDTLIMLEHPPVITLGHNASEADITVKPALLKKHQITVHKAERGGQVTYHGPGQIVGYAVIDLLALKITVEQFISNIEETMIRACKKMGIEAYRKSGSPGVFTFRGKIGAVGVRVTRGVTYHGFSFNLSPNLEHYKFIKPCGMSHADITSVRAIKGSAPPLKEARRILSDCFVEVFGMTVR